MIQRYCLGLLICVISSAVTHAQPVYQFDAFLKNSNQVVFVKSPSFTSIHGTMFLYERKNKEHLWNLADSFPVTVGRTGLAKDPQTPLAFDHPVPTKHEGDGKSPAGIFSLGPVFSYHDMKNLRMPFVHADTTALCVDDENSIYYNTLVLSDTLTHNDYNSFEYMRRQDNLYEYGVWVLYNDSPVVHGNGSCIFIHVWRNANSPTAGCTAMSKENILKLIYWLDKKKKPVLLQMAEE